MSQNAKKIGYFAHQRSGCLWYRIQRPMEFLNSKGIPTQEIHLDEDIDFDSFHTFMVYGIYPFSFGRALKKVRESGKRIIYDMDDAYSLIEPSNPFYYDVRKDLGSMNEILRYADHITVSTPEMEKHVRQWTNLPITVIPNCYTPSEWTFPRPKREGIRIGFAGSPTHVNDLLKVLPAIKSLQQKNKDVKFLIMGFGNEEYRTWYQNFRYKCPIDGIEALEAMDRMLCDIQFEWIPNVDFAYYPSTLINLSLDIGLCPLTDTPFNRCRSACKATEYTLSGALALSSDIEPYRYDESSVLVLNDEWETALDYYISDPLKIEAERMKHLDWLKENRNMETKSDLLKSVYGV